MASPSVGSESCGGVRSDGRGWIDSSRRLSKKIERLKQAGEGARGVFKVERARAD